NILTVCLLLSVSLPLLAQFSEAENVIRQMENKEVFPSAFVRGKLIIHDRFGEKTSGFDSYSLGSDYSLIEFTSVEEFGQKILRSNDDIYIYYPDAEEVIRLFGSALGDGILGSDASYEDLTGERSLLDDYEVTAFHIETQDAGGELYRIELKAKKASVPYPRQIIWIDDNLNGVSAEKYSLSNRLIKEESVLDFQNIGKYTVPVHIRIDDTLKKNSYTEFIIDDIEPDYPLDIDFFSIDELTW
ncbi:MAG: outer membrane lipoprotein-sorting protein, partial [Salinispira sp.]